MQIIAGPGAVSMMTVGASLYRAEVIGNVFPCHTMRVCFESLSFLKGLLRYLQYNIYSHIHFRS